MERRIKGETGRKQGGGRREERTGKDREQEESSRNSIPIAFPMLRLLLPALQ